MSTVRLCILLFIIINSTPVHSLVLLNWPNYMSDEVLTEFYNKTGIKVTVMSYESDETKDHLLNFLTQ